MSYNKVLDTRTFAIVTLAAHENIEHIHNRMPVIFKSDALATWMNAETSKDDALELLQENRGGDLAYYPVSKDVGKVANKGSDLIKPIA